MVRSGAPLGSGFGLTPVVAGNGRCWFCMSAAICCCMVAKAPIRAWTLGSGAGGAGG
ncbi:MAG: hypothetical protein BWZ02_03363 [Lentisphaerae bacterium ADurb.BinA184]|nr:MAG: hypothetical protein BWZ02_03363 [Lentisphaerae bacterium ADurb.BinA184]